MNRTLDYTSSVQKSFNFNLIKRFPLSHTNRTISRQIFFLLSVLNLVPWFLLFHIIALRSSLNASNASKRFDLIQLTLATCVNLFDITMNIDNSLDRHLMGDKMMGTERLASIPHSIGMKRDGWLWFGPTCKNIVIGRLFMCQKYNYRYGEKK